MKYIIEFEDEPSMVEAGLRYYQCKQVPYWGLSPEIIKNLTPYTEPDRKAIENEVWEYAWKIFLTPEDFGATMGDSYQEAKAKYEAWKKEKEKLRVGDEVRHTLSSAIGVVTQIKDLTIVWEDGSAGADREEHIEKTGCHFDEIEELLKKMRDTE